MFEDFAIGILIALVLVIIFGEEEDE